jgi:ABC-2 type transport system permease protein
MSIARLRAAFDVEFWHSFRRPLFIALAIFLALTAFGLASGKMSISSGDSTVGGTKAWITSEFAQTQMTTYLVVLYYSFFIAVAAGLSLLKDREARVDVLLHSTPMTAGEYVWGRFLAVFAAFVVVMLFHARVLQPRHAQQQRDRYPRAVFLRQLPHAGADDRRSVHRVLHRPVDVHR